MTSERPTLSQVMRRPRWIAALALTLGVAAGFAGLAQWQLGHAVANQVLSDQDSELPVKLADITQPDAPVSDFAAGRVVVVGGKYIPSDFSVVSNRVNQGEIGYWVVAHLATTSSPQSHVAVALGWTSEKTVAQRVKAELAATPMAELSAQTLTGRYMATETPVVPNPNGPADVVESMAVAQQANLWQPFEGGVYNGFIVSHDPVGGLDRIDSVPPLPQETVNWLNLFYAIEWILFALFALYFWYRIVKDAWEKELDDIDECESSASPPSNGGLTPSEAE